MVRRVFIVYDGSGVIEVCSCCCWKASRLAKNFVQTPFFVFQTLMVKPVLNVRAEGKHLAPKWANQPFPTFCLLPPSPIRKVIKIRHWCFHVLMMHHHLVRHRCRMCSVSCGGSGNYLPIRSNRWVWNVKWGCGYLLRRGLPWVSKIN